MTATPAWKSIHELDMEARTGRKLSLREWLMRIVLAPLFTGWLILGGVGLYHLDQRGGGIQGRPVMIFLGAVTIGVIYLFYRYLTWRRR